MLIKVEPRWKVPIPDSHRSVWIQNFKTIENLRDILYVRCSIPSDAIRLTVRLLYFSDAANFGVMMSAIRNLELRFIVWKRTASARNIPASVGIARIIKLLKYKGCLG